MRVAEIQVSEQLVFIYYSRRNCLPLDTGYDDSGKTSLEGPKNYVKLDCFFVRVISV